MVTVTHHGVHFNVAVVRLGGPGISGLVADDLDGFEMFAPSEWRASYGDTPPDEWWGESGPVQRRLHDEACRLAFDREWS